MTKREASSLGQLAVTPLDVTLDEYNVTEPDLLFIRADRLDIVTETGVHGAPDLVVEVLSPSTRARDLGVQMHLYLRFGIPEYWIIDPEMETLAIYHLNSDGYEVRGPFCRGETIYSALFPDAPLTVADLFQP